MCTSVQCVVEHIHVHFIPFLQLLHLKFFHSAPLLLQSVIIKSIEQNMECVYEARRQLLEVAAWPTLPTTSHTPSPTPYGGHSPTSGHHLSPVGEEAEEHEEEEENGK